MWLSPVAAFVAAVLLVPAVRWVALRAGAVDLPGGHKAHGRAVPLLGGVAVLAAVAASLAVVRPGELLWLLPAAGLAFLGLVDDLRGIRASVRLGVELVVCLGLLWATDTRLWAPPFVPGWLATALTALWLVGVINAANCFDCADGSLAGVGLLAALGVAGVAWATGSAAGVSALALAGALAGFWVYNRPPARIFLGDAGSLPVGLLVGWLAVRAASGQPAAYTLAAALVLSVPVFDFLAVHARRWRRLGWRQLLHSVGRDHLPHRLLVRAGSPHRGLAALYGLQLAATALTWVAAASPVPWPGTVALSCWVPVLLWLDDRLPEASVPAEPRSHLPAPTPARPEATG